MLVCIHANIIIIDIVWCCWAFSPFCWQNIKVIDFTIEFHAMRNLHWFQWMDRIVSMYTEFESDFECEKNIIRFWKRFMNNRTQQFIYIYVIAQTHFYLNKQILIFTNKLKIQLSFCWAKIILNKTEPNGPKSKYNKSSLCEYCLLIINHCSQLLNITI